MYRHSKAIIFLGPPGAGKGTQALRLSAALEIPAISTGEILRRECQSGTELGRELDGVLRSGQLVSDDLMERVVERRLSKGDCKGGCILDGFPRTADQAAFLDLLLSRLRLRNPLIFDFEVSAAELIERLKRRRECPTCGRIYTTDSSLGDTRMLCRNDRSLLVSRADDQPEAIRERLRTYERNAAELVRYYRSREYHPIAAAYSPDQVTRQLFDVLGLSSLAPPVPETAGLWALAAST